QIANIKRRVGKTRSIQVHNENPFAAEEQLAGFESAVRGSIGIGLQWRQGLRQLLGEPLRSVCQYRAVRRDQRGSLPCPLGRLGSSAQRTLQTDSAGVQTCQCDGGSA